MKASNAYKSFVMGPVRNTGWHTLGTCPTKILKVQW